MSGPEHISTIIGRLFEHISQRADVEQARGPESRGVDSAPGVTKPVGEQNVPAQEGAGAECSRTSRKGGLLVEAMPKAKGTRGQLSGSNIVLPPADCPSYEEPDISETQTIGTNVPVAFLGRETVGTNVPTGSFGANVPKPRPTAAGHRERVLAAIGDFVRGANVPRRPKNATGANAPVKTTVTET
jgi:hypothetical protein